METKTLRSQNQNTAVLSERFGIADSKDREIGAKATVLEADFVAATAEELVKIAAGRLSFYVENPGHYFGFRPHATRNGQDFGASHHDQLFLTARARDAAVEKYFTNARRRAIKSDPPAAAAK